MLAVWLAGDGFDLGCCWIGLGLQGLDGLLAGVGFGFGLLSLYVWSAIVLVMGCDLAAWLVAAWVLCDLGFLFP